MSHYIQPLWLFLVAKGVEHMDAHVKGTYGYMTSRQSPTSHTCRGGAWNRRLRKRTISQFMLPVIRGLWVVLHLVPHL